MATFKVTFTLDESDANYFRAIYRKAKRGVRDKDAADVVAEAQAIVARVNGSKKTPPFVKDAISVLADLVDLIQDDDYQAPARVRESVLAALAYFSDPADLIPDHIPGVGFLDDAIMVKFVEDEFKHELWGYRKFAKKRDTAEQRPWSSEAKSRLRARLEADRKSIRADIAKREAKEATARTAGRPFRW